MKSLILITVTVVFLGCATKTAYNSASYGEPDQKGLGIQVGWVKNKSSKLDAQIVLINNYPFEVVIPANSIQASVDGVATHSSTNSEIVLPANARRALVQTFEFGINTKSAVQATFTLSRVHAGVQTTKVIANSSSRAGTFSSATANATGNTAHVLGSAFTKSTSQTEVREAMDFKAGDRLPSPTLTIDLGARKPSNG